jgi:hypothetical protein
MPQCQEEGADGQGRVYEESNPAFPSCGNSETDQKSSFCFMKMMDVIFFLTAERHGRPGLRFGMGAVLADNLWVTGGRLATKAGHVPATSSMPPVDHPWLRLGCPERTLKASHERRWGKSNNRGEKWERVFFWGWLIARRGTGPAGSGSWPSVRWRSRSGELWCGSGGGLEAEAISAGLRGEGVFQRRTTADSETGGPTVDCGSLLPLFRPQPAAGGVGHADGRAWSFAAARGVVGGRPVEAEWPAGAEVEGWRGGGWRLRQSSWRMR